MAQPAAVRLDDALRTQARSHLVAFERRAIAPDGRRPAAVAVVLLAGEEGRACVLLTRRAAGLRAHATQWAFPGGRVDAGERPDQAALRELQEEVGFAPGPESVLGLLDDYGTRSGFVITPVVVWGGVVGELRPNPTEVAGVYRVPLAELENPEVPRLLTIPESDRPVLCLPIFSTTIYAPTAAILYQLREVVVHGRPTRVYHFEQPVWAWR